MPISNNKWKKTYSYWEKMENLLLDSLYQTMEEWESIKMKNILKAEGKMYKFEDPAVFVNNSENLKHNSFVDFFKKMFFIGNAKWYMELL